MNGDQGDYVKTENKVLTTVSGLQIVSILPIKIVAMEYYKAFL